MWILDVYQVQGTPRIENWKRCSHCDLKWTLRVREPVLGETGESL